MSDNCKTNTLSKIDWFIIGGYLFAIIAIYILLHGIYQPENTDDAWFLSFVYSHILRGIETDIVFGNISGQGGQSGVAAFGKTYSYIYGFILNILGWTKSHAHLISTAFLTLSAFCWFKIIKKIGFGKRFALFFSLALMLIEPFFAAANQARPDIFVFFLVSVSLLLFLERRYFASGLIAMIGIEIHPMGITAFFFFAAMLIAFPNCFEREEEVRAKNITLFCAGILLGFFYYLANHYRCLFQVPNVLLGGVVDSSQVNNFLFEYFFRTKYYRHVPEFAVILFCAGYFIWKKHYKDNVFIATFFVASLALDLFVRRANFHYVIFAYPSFLLLCLWTFRKRLRLVMALILLYLLPQYAFVLVKNRHWDFNRYLEKVTNAVPDDDLPIIGGPNDWFAFMDRPFFVTQRLRNPKFYIETFYLVEDNELRSWDIMQNVNSKYITTEINRFSDGNEDVIIKKAILK